MQYRGSFARVAWLFWGGWLAIASGACVDDEPLELAGDRADVVMKCSGEAEAEVMPSGTYQVKAAAYDQGLGAYLFELEGRDEDAVFCDEDVQVALDGGDEKRQALEVTDENVIFQVGEKVTIRLVAEPEDARSDDADSPDRVVHEHHYEWRPFDGFTQGYLIGLMAHRPYYIHPPVITSSSPAIVTGLGGHGGTLDEARHEYRRRNGDREPPRARLRTSRSRGGVGFGAGTLQRRDGQPRRSTVYKPGNARFGSPGMTRSSRSSSARTSTAHSSSRR